MSVTPVSVVVVSRGRPALLARCLTGIAQLWYDPYEIIVVADPGGVQAVRAMGWADRVKLVAFDRPNISAARNLGIAQAAGELVAFIDDDAVPEPAWLDHLAAAFHDPDVGAAGGYVRGRDGLRFQWQANLVNPMGEDVALAAPGEAPFTPAPPPGHAVKTEGTNSAFRRALVSEMGGFDPGFRFFHDETDLNMRLAAAAVATVIVPRAQVHHGYAPSARRQADTAPRSLFEIGASKALFLRKHAETGAIPGALSRFRSTQRARLVRHMVAGGLEPRDVEKLMRDLEAGIADGATRAITPLTRLAAPTQPFLAFRSTATSGRAVCLSGRVWQKAKLDRQARAHVEKGDVTTVMRFSPTARRHRMRFRKDGVWEQTGGLFGPSAQDDARFALHGFSTRAARESAIVADQRQQRKSSG